MIIFLEAGPAKYARFQVIITMTQKKGSVYVNFSIK